MSVNEKQARIMANNQTPSSFWALFTKDSEANCLTPLRLKWWFLLGYRMENACSRAPLKALGYLLKRMGGIGSGCNFPRGFSCGPGLKLPHLNGIVVSSQASLGKECKLYHQVTLGISESPTRKGAPNIGDNCVIGAGAKIIGPVHLGDNVKVGANAVVTKDVPPNSVVVGANRIISRSGSCPQSVNERI